MMSQDDELGQGRRLQNKEDTDLPQSLPGFESGQVALWHMLWLHQLARTNYHPLSGQNPCHAASQLLLCCADHGFAVPLLLLLSEAADQTDALLQSAAAADQGDALLLQVAAAADQTVALLLPAADQTVALPLPAAYQTAAGFYWICANLAADCIAALNLWSRHKE